jgi:LytS/YehU family sensor histidine kinase
VRHCDRLKVEASIDELFLDAVVPPLICQTLVENALKHGAHASDEPGTLKYALSGDEKSARFQVINPGSLKVLGTGKGTGLANARRRLQLIYGHKASITLQMLHPGEVIAELPLPRIIALS